MPDLARKVASTEPFFEPSQLLVLAGRQYNVVSLEQLELLGLSRARIRGLVASGMLTPLCPRVFLVGGLTPSPQGRLMAALLTCGSHSFLSHRTAAAVRGVRQLNPYRIDVSVPGAHIPRRKGLAVHRTRTTDGVTSSGKFRVSAYPRMLLELAPTEKPQELDRLITLGLRRNLLHLEAMEQAFTAHARRPGIGKLKQALADYRPRPERKSSLEETFDRMLAQTDLPEPQRNVIVNGWELDCYWPEYGVAVELDGRPYHLTVKDLEKDKLKDTQLALLGIQVIRPTDHRVEHEPHRVIQDVRDLLSLRGLQAGQPASSMRDGGRSAA
jgi:very-short-patch-repair endonuclease